MPRNSTGKSTQTAANNVSKKNLGNDGSVWESTTHLLLIMIIVIDQEPDYFPPTAFLSPQPLEALQHH